MGIIVAIAGSPNVGKSTLLNKITKKCLSHVGNWPGKTVDIIVGKRVYKGYEFLFIDLPGIYSLYGVTEEEKIARDYLFGKFGEKSHRHKRFICEKCPIRKYCFFSSICPIRIFSKVFEKEVERPYEYRPDVILVLADATDLLRTLLLGIQVAELFDNVVIAINKIDERPVDVKKIEEKLGIPVIGISAEKEINLDKLLDKIIEVWKKGSKKIKIDYGDVKDPELMQKKRLEFLEKIIKEDFKELEKVDRIILNPLVGIPLSFATLFIVFLLVFKIGGFFSEIIMGTSERIPIENIFVASIVKGIFLVLSFFPLIFLSIFFLELLEDSGILVRISISSNFILKKFGISGKSIFPIFLSFGCNVPAILSTRTFLNEKKALCLSIPFIICSSRLFVLVALISLIFKSALTKTLALLLFYLISIFSFLITAKLFSKRSYLLTEVPKIKLPCLDVALSNSWILSKHFLKKAGLVIIFLSFLVSLLNYYGISEKIGSFVSKIFPFNDWRIGFTIVQGFIAKEGILVTINQLGGFEDLSFSQKISFLIFSMLYTPCLATLLAIKEELKSLKYVLLSILWSFFVAYVLSLMSYFLLNIFVGF